jgi:hypothetical protein
MSKDVERLFRNINQVGIPYQVFDPPKVPSPAIGHAEPEPELAVLTAEPAPAAARSKVFRKYRAEAEVSPVAKAGAGTPLKPVFDRMREHLLAAKG